VPRFVVGAVDDLPPGTQLRVEVDGRGVAVFNVGGTFYALRDVCPHQGAQLSDGVVVGEVTADRVGEYCFVAGRHVRCPWHGWEYDLATGRSSYDPARDRVRAYDVSIAGGGELLDDGRLAGPYVAETVRISVEDDYVIVEA
jgi:3-phenylpropionate/trans-cinnamate dioxygenase ferredoxin subunit